MHKVVKENVINYLYSFHAVNTISKDKESIQTNLQNALKGFIIKSMWCSLFRILYSALYLELIVYFQKRKIELYHYKKTLIMLLVVK